MILGNRKWKIAEVFEFIICLEAFFDSVIILYKVFNQKNKNNIHLDPLLGGKGNNSPYQRLDSSELSESNNSNSGVFKKNPKSIKLNLFR